jgi:hypothetical protein
MAISLLNIGKIYVLSLMALKMLLIFYNHPNKPKDPLIFYNHPNKPKDPLSVNLRFIKIPIKLWMRGRFTANFMDSVIDFFKLVCYSPSMGFVSFLQPTLTMLRHQAVKFLSSKQFIKIWWSILNFITGKVYVSVV